MTLKEFIKKRKYLFWYIKDPVTLSKESVVEHILNYGNWDDVQTMIKIMGMKKVAKIFREQLAYFADIDYREKIEFLPGFELSDKGI